MMPAVANGRAGPPLAVGLLCGVLLMVWLAVIAPLLAWYDDRAIELADRRLLAQRLEALAKTLPAMREAASMGDMSTNMSALLEGSTDAVAGAALQGLVQDMAVRAGATLSSVETLPASPAGSYRRIGLRLSLSAPWPVLVALLQAVELGRPRMLVDEVDLQSSQMLGGENQPLLNASFTLYAFRADAGRGPNVDR